MPFSVPSRVKKLALPSAIAAALTFGMVLTSSAELLQRSFLPAFLVGRGSMVEVRALWVTRFDWTESSGASPGKIDEIVKNASYAGFNQLYFQVRGEADAYYYSGIEPWAQRMTGNLGQDPGWDPLAYMIEQAHASDIEVHAYLNVYPLWTGCIDPPDGTEPRHLYYKLRDLHGSAAGRLNGAQWSSTGELVCVPYLRVSPASAVFDEHFRAVIVDLVQRYEIDGVHLDHIRYASKQTSCDPVSQEQYGAPCSTSGEYAGWQREQINDLVSALHERLLMLNPDVWLTAAVWPIYIDNYGWGVSGAYDTYYQDAKAWLAGHYIDGVLPMIYSGNPDCSTPYFWTRERWATLVKDYVSDSSGHFIIPGIGTSYCTKDDFAEISARIEQSRASGTAGHAIFSYSGLVSKGYFDDLADGPYSVPADVPALPRNP